jgi:Putative Ig domain
VSEFRVRGLFALLFLACVAGLAGCGGGKSAITVTLTPSSAVTINQGTTQNITAAVANDSTNAGVTWSLGSSPGSLSNVTTTSVTYIAPTAISANTTATVTATSVANTSVTASLSITITAVFEFENSSLPVATQDVPYSGTISTIGATGPFTWVILSGSLPPGLTLSNSTTASVSITGTPTATGTSTFTVQVTQSSGSPISRTFTITVNPPPALTITTPATLTPGTVGQAYSYTLQASFGTPPYTWTIVNGNLPGGSGNLNLNSNGVILGTPQIAGTSTFTVQVQDSATPNPALATKNLTLTINQLVVNSELSGNYAFLLSGFDLSGKRFVAAGSFSASNGSISNGVIDTNDAGTVQNLSNLGGSYSVAATGLGTITFAGRTFALSFAPTNGNASIASAKLIEFDNADEASGVLLQQTSPFSTPSGSYAFGLLGADSTAQRYALAGAFIATTGGGGVLDSDDGGTLQTNTAFTVSTLNSPDPLTGRGTLAFSILGGANYSYYVVNPTQLLVMEIDQKATVGGTILAQSGSLGASSLSDAVFETTALSSGTALSQLGVFTTDSSSSLGTSFDKSTGGTIQSSSGTYSVGSGGRTTLSGSGLSGATDPVLYLAQPNEGFLVGTDQAVTFGFIKAQTSTSAVSGTYAGGSIPPILSGPSGEVAAATASNGTLTLTYDASASGGLLQNQSSSATYTAPVSNGRGTIQSPSSIFYVVSPDEFWTLIPGVSGAVEIFQATGATGIFQQ